MEFIIVVAVLWALGAIFGDKSGGSTTNRTNDFQKPTPKPPVAPKLPRRPLVAPEPANEPRVATQIRDVKSRSVVETLLSSIKSEQIVNKTAPPESSWQSESGGTALKEFACSPRMGDEVVEYLREQGINKLYHFTDRENVESIIRTGGLYSWDYLERSDLKIPRPGGSEFSRSRDLRDGLQDYVRLSFVRNNPMMYAAKADGRIFDAVILEVDLDVVRFPDVMFSDRNATAKNCVVGAGVEMLKNIRFALIRRGRWSSEEEKGFLQAEVLVRGAVPGYLVRHEGRIIRSPIEN